MRHPAAPEGRATPSRCRRDVDSTRCGSRSASCAGITPFNFPAMVPMWMYPLALATREHVRPQAVASRTRRPRMLIAELLAEAGLPEGVFNVVHGDKRRRRRVARAPRDRGGLVRRLNAGREVRLRDGDHAAASASRRSAGRRTSDRAAGRRPRVSRPTQLVAAGYGSAGQRCMAVSDRWSRSADAADALVEAAQARTRAVHVGPGLSPTSEMGPLVTRDGTASGSPTRSSAAGRTRRGCGRATAASFDADEEASSSVRRCSTASRPRWRSTATRSSDRCSVVIRVGTCDDAVGLDQRQLVRQRHGDLHLADGGAARGSSCDVQAGMIGINVPIPVPWRITRSEGGRTRSSAITTSTDPRESVSTRARRSVTPAGPRT